jgi:nucleotide-binding universal stress UspA family protein
MRPQVVCGLDGSRTASAAAVLGREIARRVELPFEVLHATAHPEQARVRALEDGLGQALGTDAPLRVEIGDPEARLIEASRRARLLVVGTSSRGTVRRMLFTSLTGRITRYAAAPMLAVPPRAVKDGRVRLGSGAVICAVRDRRDLAAAATAACWAREMGRAIVLAHVVPPRRIPATAVGLPHPAILETDAVRAAAGQRVLDDVASTVATIAPRACDTRVLEGAVSRKLARLAAQQDAVFIVVGRRSARLLRRSTCPVMVCPAPASVLALDVDASQEIPVVRRTPARRAL